MMTEEIAVDRLEAHPLNSNVMGEAMLGKLECHVARTGRYEPLVVRPIGGGGADGVRYQVLNGHHRLAVLRRLGHERVRCEVWEGVDDREAMLLLATLNRLEGRDDPMRRARLLCGLAETGGGEDEGAAAIGRLVKELPEDRSALERALELGLRGLPRPASSEGAGGEGLMKPMMFFLRGDEAETVGRALRAARREGTSGGDAEAPEGEATRGRGRSAALVRMAEAYLCRSEDEEAGR